MALIAKVGNRALSACLDFLLPPCCIVTGQGVDHQGMLSPDAWAGLHFIDDPYCACCGVPFEYDVTMDMSDMLCVQCLDHPPPFVSGRSALVYNAVSRKMVLGFKHADKIYSARVFTPWLMRAGAEMLKEADYIVPVPLHYWRMVHRRYNQAAILAQVLGKAANVPALTSGLQRLRSTPSQGSLGLKERHKNVRKAFAVPRHHYAQIQSKTIVLIDDVYTTGATLKECTRALLKAGAGKVHVLTLARVLRDG